MLLILTLFSAVINYFNSRSNGFIPQEYRYPDSKIGAGKTFIYQNSVTDKRIFRDFRNLDSNGQHFLIVKSYDSASVSDSTKYLNDKVVDVYNFYMNQDRSPVRAELILDTVLNKEQKLGVHITKDRYQAKELTYIINAKEQYLKDTTMTWEGKPLPCLVTLASANIEIKVKADTSVNYSLRTFSRFYYAKGIGEIRYTIQFTDHTGKDNYDMWDLKNIRDIKN